jgi:hypothetical protein
MCWQDHEIMKRCRSVVRQQTVQLNVWDLLFDHNPKRIAFMIGWNANGTNWFWWGNNVPSAVTPSFALSSSVPLSVFQYGSLITDQIYWYNDTAQQTIVIWESVLIVGTLAELEQLIKRQ